MQNLGDQTYGRRDPVSSPVTGESDLVHDSMFSHILAWCGDDGVVSHDLPEIVS